MAVPIMVRNGKIIQFDIKVFLEAQEMNLRGNLGTFLCFTNKFLIFLL